MGKFGMGNVRRAVYTWLLDAGLVESMRWERRGGRWRQKKVVTASGGGLEESEIVDIELRRLTPRDASRCVHV